MEKKKQEKEKLLTKGKSKSKGKGKSVPKAKATPSAKATPKAKATPSANATPNVKARITPEDFNGVSLSDLKIEDCNVVIDGKQVTQKTLVEIRGHNVKSITVKLLQKVQHPQGVQI